MSSSESLASLQSISKALGSSLTPGEKALNKAKVQPHIPPISRPDVEAKFIECLNEARSARSPGMAVVGVEDGGKKSLIASIVKANTIPELVQISLLGFASLEEVEQLTNHLCDPFNFPRGAVVCLNVAPNRYSSFHKPLFAAAHTNQIFLILLLTPSTFSDFEHWQTSEPTPLSLVRFNLPHYITDARQGSEMFRNFLATAPSGMASHNIPLNNITLQAFRQRIAREFSFESDMSSSYLKKLKQEVLQKAATITTAKHVLEVFADIGQKYLSQGEQKEAKLAERPQDNSIAAASEFCQRWSEVKSLYAAADVFFRAGQHASKEICAAKLRRIEEILSQPAFQQQSEEKQNQQPVLPQGDPHSWDYHQVLAFLSYHGIPAAVRSHFEQHAVNGDVFLNLSPDVLSEWGINDATIREVIASLIRQLNLIWQVQDFSDRVRRQLELDDTSQSEQLRKILAALTDQQQALSSIQAQNSKQRVKSKNSMDVVEALLVQVTEMLAPLQADVAFIKAHHQ
eukprot:TRINITY_DN7958_c0_g1_i5.p1 TRINITY_DN7958_c0_g1~~TRINITY_DN7958_c0_g1_i5.p1  ORF type:complete len:514 (+),score=99.98 TRINITY_DN7958_c0_g1_i5:49-1590(+)